MEKIEKITDILFCEIETEDGVKLGRVFDVRSEGEPEHGFPNKERKISELLYGMRSFLETLGFKETELERVAWSEIVKIEDGIIIVAGNTRKGKKHEAQEK
jgi:sporulation protein YlmC with PRC-barrel domain